MQPFLTGTVAKKVASPTSFLPTLSSTDSEQIGHITLFRGFCEEREESCDDSANGAESLRWEETEPHSALDSIVAQTSVADPEGVPWNGTPLFTRMLIIILILQLFVHVAK